MAKSKIATETRKLFKPGKVEFEVHMFLIKRLKHVLSLTATYSRPEILINSLKKNEIGQRILRKI
jgi:hypothetical protein